MNDGLPPQNIEAERGILGSMLIEPEAVLVGLSTLDPTDFYQEGHSKIFIAARELQSKDRPVDLLTICEQLSNTGELDRVGGRGYVASLTTGTVTSGNFAHYADIVKEKSLRRRLIHLGGDISALAMSESRDIEELINDIVGRVITTTEGKSTSKVSSLSDLIPPVFEQMEAAKRGESTPSIPYGLSDIDGLTGGINNGDYCVIAARPSQGKTSLALDIAINMAVLGHRVGMLSLEMKEEQIGRRILAKESGVSYTQIQKGMISSKQGKAISECMPMLSKLPLYVKDGVSHIYDIQATVQRLIMQHKVEVFVVDYLQLIVPASTRGNHTEQTTDISKALKNMAQRVDRPIIVLSQLSREVEKREDCRPQLSDLRQSGAIEQDADVVMFVYRKEPYLKEGRSQSTFGTYVIGNENVPSEGVAEIIISKNRNGPIGSAYLQFANQTMKFQNLTLRENHARNHYDDY